MTSTEIGFGSRSRLAAVSAGILLALFGSAQAGVINVPSVSFADVNSAVALAADGDTVVIPAGTAIWASTLNVTKAITLQGAGIGGTIVQDNAPNPTSQSAILIDVTLVPGKTTRITGLEFRGLRTAGGSSVIELNGINNDGSRARVDHCKFNLVNMTCMVWPKGVIGVIDHCEHIINGTGGFLCYVFHENWNGGSKSDKSWSDDAHWGTDQFWFIEDNIISAGGGSAGAACMDSYRGARWVFRHNTVKNCNLSAHGTESSGRTRGTRAVEVYDNTFTVAADPPQTATGVSRSTVLNLRSGSALMHHNTSTGFGGNWALRTDDDRLAGNYKAFGAADGDIPWDNMISNPRESGTATGGSALTLTDTSKTWTPNDKWKGYVIRQVKLSGTATGGDNNSMIDTSKSWVANQWARYMIKDTTTGKWGYIDSNTANTINYTGFGAATFAAGNTYEIVNASYITDSTSNSLTYFGAIIGPDVAFSGGEKYQINKVDETLDAPGRGKCDDLGGATNPSPQNLNQVTEPVYEWLNSHNGQPSANTIYIGSNYPSVFRAGEHCKNNTIKPGYSPFVYPHPLVSGVPAGPAAPAAPANLRVAPTQ